MVISYVLKVPNKKDMFIFGNEMGEIYLLSYGLKEQFFGQEQKLYLKLLGKLPQANHICNIYANYYYLSSKYEDSHIIHLTDELQTDDQLLPFIQVKHVIKHLGPITTIQTMQFDDELENKIMTSTPHKQVNHINIFERGISYKVQQTLSITDIKKTWLLSFSKSLFLLIIQKSTVHYFYTVKIRDFSGDYIKPKISINKLSFTEE